MWMTAFYRPNQVHSLALPAHLSLGNNAKAEAHAHRYLSLLPDHMQRSRTLTTARLPRPQLLALVRQTVLDVYADVRAPLPHLANYRVEAFSERLDRHATEPGFALASATTWENRSATRMRTPSSRTTAGGNAWPRQ